MIKKLEINGVHTVATQDLQKYISKKIGKLDHHMPKSAKASVHAEVFVKEAKAKDKNKCTCEVILYLPKETITVKETTINMFAAVDIVEAKLKNQIKKYKDLHTSPKLHRRLVARFRRRGGIEERG